MVFNIGLRQDNEKNKFLNDGNDNPAVRVINFNSLVPSSYDAIDLTYVASGNGVGEVETVTYKLSGSTVATLTLSYDASNRLSGVSKS